MSNVDFKQLMTAASAEIAKLKEKLQLLEQERHEPVAVVGMACRLPGGVKDPDGFWQLLRDGVDGVIEITDQRGWRMADFFDPDPASKGKINSRYQGFVSDIEWFDADFLVSRPRRQSGSIRNSVCCWKWPGRRWNRQHAHQIPSVAAIPAFFWASPALITPRCN